MKCYDARVAQREKVKSWGNISALQLQEENAQTIMPNATVAPGSHVTSSALTAGKQSIRIQEPGSSISAEE